MKAVELFAGAGGLGMGVSLAGYEHTAVIEWNNWACETLRENKQRCFPLVTDWPLHKGDVRLFDYSSIQTPIDLVAGGPPCQPFSLGGKHGAHSDKRDMFPTTIDVIRKLRPRAFLIENVKGLTRASFSNYLEYTHLQLSFPDILRKKDESWINHLARLERQKTSGETTDQAYNVVRRVLNAANFGIPQKRERIFLVGFRNDLNASWTFPTETHSLDALLYQQFVTGEYWDRHKVASKEQPLLPKQTRKRVEKLRSDYRLAKPATRPWRTVRDALEGLPDPEKQPDRGTPTNHTFQPGARVYPGHTGSPLDLPAKTLKAGDHGVPGGENMMVKANGEVRYFTVRESARLQSFPDGYVFHGSWTETMRQLGNAVPVALARLLAASIAEKLVEAEATSITKENGEGMLQ